MNTQGLIDKRNINLWDTLNSVHEIVIQREVRNDYLAFSKSRKTIIYVPENNINSSSFTHELLHIYLRSKQVFIGGGLTNSIRGNQSLSKIISEKLLEHIGNCLDHIKMLPEFLRLGYNEKDFLSDYETNKLTKEEITRIKRHFATKGLSGRVYNASAIDLYIGKYFAANACPSKTINYSIELRELNQIDSELFQILERFLMNWRNFDPDDKDIVTGGYHHFLFDFTNGLEEWIRGKTIE